MTARIGLMIALAMALLLALAGAALWLRWDATRDARAAAEAAHTRATLQTLERMDHADTGTSDPDDDLRWLRQRAGR